MKYRKKPVAVEAFKLGEEYPDWFASEVSAGRIMTHREPPLQGDPFDHHGTMTADIETLEGKMHASSGDYIIRGVNGEIYPCKPDIFEKTYEPEPPKEAQHDN